MSHHYIKDFSCTIQSTQTINSTPFVTLQDIIPLHTAIQSFLDIYKWDKDDFHLLNASALHSALPRMEKEDFLTNIFSTTLRYSQLSSSFAMAIEKLFICKYIQKHVKRHINKFVRKQLDCVTSQNMDMNNIPSMIDSYIDYLICLDSIHYFFTVFDQNMISVSTFDVQRSKEPQTGNILYIPIDKLKKGLENQMAKYIAFTVFLPKQDIVIYGNPLDVSNYI